MSTTTRSGSDEPSSDASSSSTDTSSDSSSTDTASDSSSVFDGAIDPEQESSLRHEARVASIAVKHVKLAHLDDVLVHIARAINKALAEGRLEPKDLENWSDDDWEQTVLSVTKANPHTALPPKAKPNLPSIKRRNPY